MEQKQRYKIFMVLASLVVTAGLLYFSLRYFSSTIRESEPVEPKVQPDDNGLFELWFANADLFDLSVDRNVTGILFATSANKVSLLDRERKLRWEMSFHGEPLQAKISACGGYLAVTTAGGNLFFASTGQKVWWEKELAEPAYRAALSANGLWLAVGHGLPDSEQHSLDLYRRDGSLQWSLESGPVLNLELVGEQADQGRIIFTQIREGAVVTTAVNLEGELLWEHEGYALAAVSRTGNRLAAVHDDELIILDNLGQILWEAALPFNVEAVRFNPQNHNVLAYGAADGSEDNLCYYSAEGDLLWKERIADGSLFSFTADGRRIITSSWRHYKDDFSQMVLLDQNGAELNRWEVALRVERLVVTGNRRYAVLAGEDGYIEIIDLEAGLGPGEENETTLPLYSPAVNGSGDERVTLFFYDNNCLVPVSRAIGQTGNRIRAAVEELIRGPARESALYRTIPKEAQVEVSFREETGQLYLDFSPPEIVQMAGAEQSLAALDSLTYTLGLFPEVREIYLTVNHEPLEIFGDGLYLEQPLKPHRWQYPVYVPVRLGERYHLVPREARDLEIERRDLDGLLQAVLRTCRTFYFVPGDLRLLGVEESSNTVKINLNGSLRMLFPEGGGDEERLQAALLLDALFLTAAGNSDLKKVEILVEGEHWEPPQGFPLLSRTFHYRHYLNPEP